MIFKGNKTRITELGNQLKTIWRKMLSQLPPALSISYVPKGLYIKAPIKADVHDVSVSTFQLITLFICQAFVLQCILLPSNHALVPMIRLHQKTIFSVISGVEQIRWNILRILGSNHQGIPSHRRIAVNRQPLQRQHSKSHIRYMTVNEEKI